MVKVKYLHPPLSILVRSIQTPSPALTPPSPWIPFLLQPAFVISPRAFPVKLTSFCRIKTAGNIVGRRLCQVPGRAISHLPIAHTHTQARTYTHTHTHNRQPRNNDTASPEAICEIRGCKLTQRASERANERLLPPEPASHASAHVDLHCVRFFLPLTSHHLASSCLIPRS